MDAAVFLKCIFCREAVYCSKCRGILSNLTKKQCFAAIVNRKKLKLIVHRLDFKLRVEKGYKVRYSVLQSKANVE
jgi:hypothetical protein